MLKMSKKKRCRYQISYYDPADPAGEKWKTWKNKSKKKLKKGQNDLKIAWEESAKQFPIKRVCK